MRPLRGVVIQASRRSLVIKIETGQRLEADNRRLKLGRFDQVHVYYDYTRNEIVDIVPFDPNLESGEGADESTIELLEDGEHEDPPVESLEAVDSGALCPDCDGYWDSEEGVLVVEGESSTEHI
jgi:hypothetical protein